MANILVFFEVVMMLLVFVHHNEDILWYCFRLSSENELDSTNEFTVIHDATEPCSISSKTKKPKLSLYAEEPEDNHVMSSTLVLAAPDTVAESMSLLESEDIVLSTFTSQPASCVLRLRFGSRNHRQHIWDIWWQRILTKTQNDVDI